MIHDFAAVLSWRDPLAPRAVRQRHDRRVATLLGARADLPRLRAATPTALERLCRAPELHRVLTRAPDARDAPLEVLVEAWLAAEAHDVDRPTWTALGDRLHDRHGVRYEAPVVDGRVVDFDSPNLARPLESPRPGYPRHPAPVPPELRGPFCDVLGQALDDVDRALPAAGALVRSQLTVVVPRIDPRQPDWSTSASSRAEVGKVLIINPLAPGVDPARLAEFLVHESIHHYLYRAEAEVPLVPDGATALPEDTVCSPWTGSALPLPTLVHACCVWFGLLRFWEGAAPGVFPAARVDALRERAAHGFGAPLRRLLEAHRSRIGTAFYERVLPMVAA